MKADYVKMLRMFAHYATALANDLESSSEITLEVLRRHRMTKPGNYLGFTGQLKEVFNTLAQLPEVVLPPLHHYATTRQELKKQPCFYCGITLKAKKMTLDHFVPLFFRGINKNVNIVPACRTCNLSKGSNLPSPHQIYKFQRRYPSVAVIDLLEPYAFLLPEQQARMDWFLVCWATHAAVYRLQHNENTTILSKASGSPPAA